ncbi:MAG: hypothetical protein H6623_02935 [Bdellovibrionaceae bacterium]|nr:hypothetical protein [Pseudobdellovibrionaceae bacterium]
MGTKAVYRSCRWFGLFGASLTFVFAIPLVTFADPIAVHNQEFREVSRKITVYEIRVKELIDKKGKLKAGPELEDVLTEIADLQKELVGIKKKRRLIREHIDKEHPREELMGDLSVLKDVESEKTAKTGGKADPGVDSRLDTLLAELRKQYARTNRSDQEDYQGAQEELVQERIKHKRTIQQEDKDEYIKENLKSTLEIH